MEVEEYLADLKQHYLQSKPSKDLEQQGLAKLMVVLEQVPQVQPKAWSRVFTYQSFGLLATLLVFLAAGLFSLAWATKSSLPGETLYPIKRVAENIIARSLDPQIKVDDRADEIVNLAKQGEQNNQQLTKTVIDYKQAVDQSVNQASSSARQAQQLEQKLEDHKEQFQQVIKQAPQAKEEIKQAIEITSTQHHGENHSHSKGKD